MLGSDEDAVTCWCRIENEKEPENLNYYIGIDYAAWCVTKTANHLRVNDCDIYVATVFSRLRHYTCVTMFECRFGHFFHPRGGGLGRM